MSLERRAPGVHVVTHALVREEVTVLRDVGTGPARFRRGLERLGRLTGEVLCDERFGTEPVAVETPLTTTEGERVAGRAAVVLVNVLRAATPMVEGLWEAFPDASGGAISASRQEHAGRDDDGTFPIEVNYVKLPEIGTEDTVVVADPMLATGSTMEAVLDEIEGRAPAEEPARVICCAVVAAPAGIERVREHPLDAEIVTGAVDDHLDDDGFIVPGLGDAGDRAFNTR